MSYREYACTAYMLPATLANARLLGVSDEEIMEALDFVGTREGDETLEQWWDEMAVEAGYEQASITGKASDGKPFRIEFMHIGECVEYDDKMDVNTSTYFSFDFADLFTPTPLFKELQKVGVDYYTWVEGG